MKRKLNQRENFKVYLILGDYEEQSSSNTGENKGRRMTQAME